MYILLVDKDIDHVKVCKKVLFANGHSVEHATSADSAILKMQYEEFDTVLIDLEIFTILNQENTDFIKNVQTNIFLFADLENIPNSFRALQDTYDVLPKPLDLTKMMFIQGSLHDISHGSREELRKLFLNDSDTRYIPNQASDIWKQ